MNETDLRPEFKDRLACFRRVWTPAQRAVHERVEVLCCASASDTVSRLTAAEIRRVPSDGWLLGQLLSPPVDRNVTVIDWARVVAGFAQRLALAYKVEPGYVPFMHAAQCGVFACEECGCFMARASRPPGEYTWLSDRSRWVFEEADEAPLSYFEKGKTIQ